jgi:phosphoribosylamine--glycine ligase
MKLLVIGSGGREHALVWKLAQSPHVTQIWCAPGNGGIAGERLATSQSLVECVNIGAEDLGKLAAFAQEKSADLTVVGPDNPWGPGLVHRSCAVLGGIIRPTERRPRVDHHSSARA